MSIWLEIHCDVNCGTPPPNWTGTHPYCYTHNNNNPGAMASNNLKSIGRVIRHLDHVARKGGWIKTHKQGWICPNCRKVA